MPNFNITPRNFYGKSIKQPDILPNQSVQPASPQRSLHNRSARGVTNKPLPGVRPLLNAAFNEATAFLQNLGNNPQLNSFNNLVDSATAVNLVQSGSTYNYNVDPTTNRLLNNNLPAGGQYGFNNSPQNSSAPIVNFAVDTPENDATENRVIIRDQTGLFIADAASFGLLKATGGVLFPYTPVISTNHRANYELEGLVHTVYSTPYFTNSTVDSINLQARFTCQTETEGLYILQMIAFFRTATKMFYGASQNRGTPPPILFLDGYGKYLFDHVPVVIKDFQYSLPNDVNYITVNQSKGPTSVPVELNVTLDMTPTYSRTRISKFDLVAFSKGDLLTSGNAARPGGWI